MKAEDILADLDRFLAAVQGRAVTLHLRPEQHAELKRKGVPSTLADPPTYRGHPIKVIRDRP